MIGLLTKSWAHFLFLFLPHFFLFLFCCSCWYAVETIDPIEINGQTTKSLICFKQSKVQTRYCPNCRKSVEGLDHHCVWLNTCIGSKNYVPFLGLIVNGFLQMAWQVLVIVLYLTLWCDDDLKSQYASIASNCFSLSSSLSFPQNLSSSPDKVLFPPSLDTLLRLWCRGVVVHHHPSLSSLSSPLGSYGNLRLAPLSVSFPLIPPLCFPLSALQR
jgi:hypothetical protein